MDTLSIQDPASAHVTDAVSGISLRLGPGRPDIDLSQQVLVMGIVNRTRDSFFDGGATFACEQSVSRAIEHVAHGADVVDIGAVAFSSNAEQPTPQQELQLLLPVIEGIRASSSIAISVDTTRAEVAAGALAAGADIVNDTSALSDPDMADVVAEHDATVILTHSLRSPGQHLKAPPHYDDVVKSVQSFFDEGLTQLIDAGIRRQHIVLDPGPDLHKNTRHTLELIRRFAEFSKWGLPLLAAVSNKDFVGETLSAPKQDRGVGSAVTSAMLIERGARMIRTHDCHAMDQVRTMVSAIVGWHLPEGLRHNM